MLESTKEDATGLPEGSDIGLGAGCRRFESCHLDQINGMQLICMPFFYCLCALSPGLEPAFNRAASRSRTLRVRASSPVTSTSSLWTSYRSQRLFQSHFSLTLSQLLFQHDPLRWARAGFLNGMQSICIPFFIVCTILRQASNLFSIAPRAEPDLPHAVFECIMKENPFLLSGETL